MMYTYTIKKLKKTLGCCCALLSTLTLSVPVLSVDTIDVMVLYTTDAEQLRRGAINTYINHVISSANMAYQASQMTTRLRLIHSQKMDINGTERVGSNALTTFQSSAQVRELREKHGADFVALLNLSQPVRNGKICGIAYIASGSNGKLRRGSENSAYSLSGTDCGARTFTHELGHNMGLGHSRKQGSRGGVYDFGVGHGVQHTFSTIMAYSHVFNARGLERFSNPNVNCNGLPCGVDKHSRDGADAAYAVNQVASQLAAYLPSKTGGGGGGGGTNPDPVNQVPAIPGNLIENASFEAGTSPWFGQFGSQLSLDSQKRFTGEHSAEVTNRRAFYSGIAQSLDGKLSNGRKYKISGAMKLDSNSTDRGRMVIGFNDSQGTQYIYFDRVGINGDSWTTLSGEFTLSTVGKVNSIYALFYGPEASKNFYVDQVSIQEVGVNNPPTPPDGGQPPSNNLVANGDIETGTTSSWASAYYSRLQVSDSVMHSGNYGLYSSQRYRWYSGPAQEITTKVQSGKTYQLSAWVRMERGRDNIEARLYYQDDNGHNWLRFDKQTVDTSWMQLSGSVNIAAKGNIRKARLHFFGPRQGTNFYVDDVKLME